MGSTAARPTSTTTCAGESAGGHGNRIVELKIGGVGSQRGYCLMIAAVRTSSSVGRVVRQWHMEQPRRGAKTPKASVPSTEIEGLLHCGPRRRTLRKCSQRHRVRLMKSYAEGFDILRQLDGIASRRSALPRFGEKTRVAARHVVSSWLRAAVSPARGSAARRMKGPSAIRRGRGPVAAASRRRPADVLTTALFARFRSRRDHTFAEKLLSALRAQFGGHAEPR